MTAQPATKIPELEDEDVDALMYVAGMAYEAGKFQDAYNLYRGASIARPKNSKAAVGMGISLYCLGRSEEAEAQYRRAIDLDGGNQEAHLYLGELIWNEKKDAAGAEAHLATAFRIHPRNRIGARARFILSSIKQK